MILDLSTPALLFPAIAILMLGFVNRYVSVAGVIRTFRKDYDKGYKHVNLVAQLHILQERIMLLRVAMAFSAVALMLACLSMLCIYTTNITPAKLAFALSLACMVIALVTSLFETKLSNGSLNIEIDDMLRKELAKRHEQHTKH